MKAIITAGGKGTRLFPISRAYPKELIQFCGIPVIEYGINLLRDSGINDIIIVTGIKKGALQDYLGNGEIFGVNIAYLIQEQPKGLGHSVAITEPYISSNNFVLLLGDTILINSDLKEMINLHNKYNASSTILIEYTKEPERYGVVKFDNSYDKINRIISVYEKPKEQEMKNKFKVNIDDTIGWCAIAGLYVFDRSIFDFLRKTPIDKNNELQLTDAIRLSLKNNNTTIGYILDGKRIDVGTWNYIKDERNFYLNMDDNKLNEIIKSRHDKMNYFLRG